MSTAAKVGRGIGKTVKWTLIAGALVIVLVVILAIVGLGKGVSNSQSNGNAVTPAKYAAVHDGMTRAQVVALIGKQPEATDSTVVSGQTDSCIEYGLLAKTTTQFCFWNGKLNLKSQF